VSFHEHVCANDNKVEGALQQPLSWREIKASMEEFNHQSHMGLSVLNLVAMLQNL
jgi:hypothetical protein